MEFTRIDQRRARYMAFVLLMLSINVIDGLVVRSITDPQRRSIVAIAASFDVIAVVSALYYGLLVRPAIRGPRSVAAVALLGALHATYFFPGTTIVRGMTPAVCEAGLIAFVIAGVRRDLKRAARTEADLDPLEAIRRYIERVVTTPFAAGLLTAELGILHYALFSWRAKPHAPAGEQAFSIHKKAGRAELMALLPIACVFEIVPAHLVLRHWSPALAWVATGCSVYSVIWLVGLSRAFRLRPVLVARDYIDIRYGLLFQSRLPAAMITRIRRAEALDARDAVPRKSTPALCIELAAPVDAKGAFGMRKRVSRVAITPDDDKAFQRALAVHDYPVEQA